MTVRDFTILYDEPQEARWFRRLHPALADAAEASITERKGQSSLAKVLCYDRPDIVLLHQDKPILVVEETVEVPSGHNVGQRFARIAAAAECHVPLLYFGPYVAKKHGGETAGPRYMNIRLFHAMEAMIRTTGTAITTINWPVDARFEVRRDPDKDADVREYLSAFFESYARHGMKGINAAILQSDIHLRMLVERDQFAKTRIRNPEQYNGPPDSVEMMPLQDFKRRFKPAAVDRNITEVILYNVGMTYMRSDPYTGMAMLYHYLYIVEHSHRALFLWFPNITVGDWREAARKPKRKDVRLYKAAADGIAFRDGFLLKEQL